MGPGGGDRARAGSSGHRMKLKGRRKAPACQNSRPFLATRCLGAEPGSRVHRGWTPVGRDGPAESRAAVPEEAQLCRVCCGGRDTPGRSQVRAEGRPPGWQRAGRGWAPAAAGGPQRPNLAQWRMLARGRCEGRAGGVAPAPAAGPCWGPGSGTGPVSGLEPLGEGSSSEPRGRALGSGFCVLTSQRNAGGASERIVAASALRFWPMAPLSEAEGRRVAAWRLEASQDHWDEKGRAGKDCACRQREDWEQARGVCSRLRLRGGTQRSLALVSARGGLGWGWGQGPGLSPVCFPAQPRGGWTWGPPGVSPALTQL